MIGKISLAALMVVPLGVAVRAADRPNIVFIMADDLGIGDTGVTGQNARAALGLPSFATPNIDSIALEGARFNNMYSGSSQCSSTRAILMTGFHHAHTMIDRANESQDIRGGEQDKTWGQILQQAGYKTGFFGKWHLGGFLNDVRAPQSLPTQKGFETAYSVGFRQVIQWESDGAGGMRKTLTPLDPTYTGPGGPYAFGENLIADRAIQFIRGNATAGQSFAAYVPFIAPHSPLNQVPPEHPNAGLSWPQPQRDYAGLMYNLDQHVGQILAALDDPNNDGNTSDSVAENTIVVFASDNGPNVLDAAGFDAAFFDSNSIYQGLKFLMQDGGVRTPFFVRWKGTIAPGTVNDAHVGSFADILPTIAELVGQDVPLGVDGRSMASLLTGTSPSEGAEVVGWSKERPHGAALPGGWAIRVGNWKLHHQLPHNFQTTTVTYRLYNLAADPGELVDLSNSRPDIVAALDSIAFAEGFGREPIAPLAADPFVPESKAAYFTQYKSWSPQPDSDDFFNPLNWSGGTPNSGLIGDPAALNWNTGPADNWLATMINTTNAAKQVALGADAAILAIDVRGNEAPMQLIVPAGRVLRARNGVRISSNGVVQLQGGEINTTHEIDIRPGGRLVAEGSINGQQAVLAGIPEFSGLSLFDPKVINQGTFDVGVGAVAGSLTIHGQYEQKTSGAIRFDLFGSGGTPGVDFDRITIERNAILAGLLDIAAAPGGWAPQLGDSFEILTAAGGISGAFSTVTAPPLAAGLTWNVLYSSTSVALQVVEQSFPNLTIAPGHPLGDNVTIALDQVLDLAGSLRIGQNLSPGSLTVGVGGSVNVANGTTVDPAGVLTLDGGRLRTAAINIAPGGTLNWNSGILNIAGNLSASPGQGIGANAEIRNGQTLDVDGGLNVAAGDLAIRTGGVVHADAGATLGPEGGLTLDGGVLVTSNLDSAEGSFTWLSGTLRFTSDQTVAAAGALGEDVSIEKGQRLQLAQNLNVGDGVNPGVLRIHDDGEVALGNELVIGATGHVTLAGGALSLRSLHNVDGGAFDWQGGALRFDGGLVVAPTGNLGPTVDVGGGKSLTVAGFLSIDNGMVVIGPDGLVDVGAATDVGAGATLELTGGVLSTSAINVAPGGVFNWVSGTLRFLGGFAVEPGGALGDTVAISGGRELIAVDGVSVGDGGMLTLDGGVITGQALDVGDGGTFTWNSGRLSLASDVTVAAGRFFENLSLGINQSFAAANLVVGDNGALGVVTVNHGAVVEVAGATAIGTAGALSLDGGSLTTGTIDVHMGGVLRFNSGAVTLTGADGLLIGEAGMFGEAVSISPGQFLTVTNTTTIEAGALLSVNGGQLSTGALHVDGGTYQAANLNGLGAVVLDAGALRVTEPIALSANGPLGTHVLIADNQTFIADAQLALGQSDSPVTLLIESGGNVEVGGTTTIRSGSNLLLSGGRFSTSGLIGELGASFAWNSGILRFNNGLTIAPQGDLGELAVVLSDQKLEVANQLLVGAGSLTVAEGGEVVADSTSLEPPAVVALAGGKFSTGSLQHAAGAAFNWQFGELHFTGDLNVTQGSSIALALGQEMEIGAGRHLSAAGVATINGPLKLAGGTLTAGQLANGAAINFVAGTINLTGAGLDIAPGGAFGATLALHVNNTLNVANVVEVAPGSLATIDSGAVFNAESLNNRGEILLEGLSAALTANQSFTNSGIVRGLGRIGGPVVNESAGEVIVIGGRRLNFLGATFENLGRVSVTGSQTESAEIVFDGALTNRPGGAIVASHARVRMPGGAENAGSITVTGGDNHFFGNINNVGEIVVTGGGTTTFYDNLAQNGVLRVSKSGDTTSVAVFLGMVTGVGGSTGDGDIFFEGGLEPGSSPALVNFNSNLFFGGSSTLNIELAGTTPGQEFDQIIAGGAVRLNGALNVELINGFAPTAGQTFEFLSSDSSVTGAFAHTLLPTLPGNLAWNIAYQADSVVLEVLGVQADAADFDVDGDVDGADFLTWQRGIGAGNASHEQGDADGSGAVDGTDLAIWRSQAGAPTPGGIAAVPEPQRMQLAALAGATLLACIRRRRRG